MERRQSRSPLGVPLTNQPVHGIAGAAGATCATGASLLLRAMMLLRDTCAATASGTGVQCFQFSPLNPHDSGL